MYELEVSKEAKKAFNKAQFRVQTRINDCLAYLIDFGTYGSPYPIKPLKGRFQKFNYYEAKIDKDYRIIFRREGDTFYIRAAGTHNDLKTG